MSAPAQPDIRSVLDPLDVPKELKAAAWDDFHSAANPGDFRARFDKLNLPREAKAALWDAKFSDGAVPKTSTPAGEVLRPAPEQGFLETLVSPVTEGALGRAMGWSTETAAARSEEPTNPVLRFQELTPQAGAARGAAEFMSEMTTPGNLLLLAGTGGLGALESQVGRSALSKALSATFSVDMLHNAYQQVPEFKRAVDAGDWASARQTLAHIGLSSVMSALGLRHAATGMVPAEAPAGAEHPLARTAPSRAQVRQRSAEMARQAEDYEANLPYVDRLERITNEALAAERANPPNRLRAPQIRREIEKRVQAKTWQEPAWEAPPEPRMNRAQRRATVMPPEEGAPEDAYRTQDARERAALELENKPWSELDNSQRLVIDDLLREQRGRERGTRLQQASAETDPETVTAGATESGARTAFDTPEVIEARRRAEEMHPTRLIETPERQALRERIEGELFQTEGMDRNRQAYLVVGPPAAGKSSAVAEPLAREVRGLIIDSDLAKAKLPEYGKGEGAMAVHEESAQIAKRVLERAAAEGVNIVHPIVGRSPDRIRALRDELRENGYDVHLVHVDVPREVATRRAIARFQDSGRFVDPDYVYNKVGDLPKRSYDTLKSEGGFKSYAEFSNDVPRGERPRFIGGNNPELQRLGQDTSGPELRGLLRADRGPGGQAIDRGLEEAPRGGLATPERQAVSQLSATPADPVSEAKSRIVQRLRDERGSFSLKPAAEGPSMLDDLVTVGAHYLRTAASSFREWSARMISDFGEAIRPQLLSVYARAKRIHEAYRNSPLGSERGSFSTKPVAEAEAEPGGKGAAPKKTPAATATPPEERALTTSPSYDVTKGNILRKVDVSEGERGELAKLMQGWEEAHPERRAVTFEDIRSEARALDPRLLLELKRPGPGETLNPAVRYAARERLNGLTDEIHRRRTQLESKAGTMDPVLVLEEEQRIEGLERNAKGLLDVLIPTRSQDGRNLAYHRMVAEKSFDTEYWVSRAKRSMGLPPGATPPAEVTREIGEITARGRAAEKAAERRIRAEAETAGPRVTYRSRSRATVGPEFEAEQARLEGARKAAAAARQKDQEALTTEQKNQIARDPTVKRARIELAEKMRDLDRSGVAETITALRAAGLLTGIKTHLRNIGGNAAFQVLEETARIPAAVVDAGFRLFAGRERTVSMADPGAVARATYAAATRGMREAAEIMRRGATQDELAKMDFRRELNSGSKVVDTYANTVFRSLSAEDRVFRVYAYERSLQEQMKLAKVKTPTEAMRTQAIADAEFATFNNKNMAAAALGRAQGALREHGAAGKAASFAIDVAVPFKNTPANIIARVLDYSGGGFVKAGFATARAIADRALTAEQQHAISMGIGRGMTGAALIILGYRLAEAKLMTGSAPEDSGRRNTNEAAGRLAGAIRVGNTWQQIGAFSPVGNLLVIGATLHDESIRNVKDAARRPGLMAAVGTKTVMEQPMLQGFESARNALNNPVSAGARYVSSTAGSFVPTAVSDVASLADSKRRESRGEGVTDTVLGGVASRVPGWRNTLPERRDALGRTLPQSKAAAINPGIGSEAKELHDEMLGELVAQGVTLSKPQRKPGEGLREWRARQELTGRIVEEHLREAVADGDYRELPDRSSGDESRRLALQKAIHQGQAEVNRLLNRSDFKELRMSERIDRLKELLNDH